MIFAFDSDSINLFSVEIYLPCSTTLEAPIASSSKKFPEFNSLFMEPESLLICIRGYNPGKMERSTQIYFVKNTLTFTVVV